MNAYKFLARGAVGPLSGFAWPTPGEWIEVEGPLVVCERGVHVCRSFELAHWLHDELWETEIDGDQLEGIDCLVVRRARLVRRIDAWTDGGAERFADVCIERAKTMAASHAGEIIDDATRAARAGYPAVAGYCAVLAITRMSDDPERTYANERVWQSEWIARELCARSAL